MTQPEALKQPTAEELGAALTDRYKKFADHYLGDCKLNASAAAKKAGYKDHRQGWRIIRDLAVKAYVAARLAENADVMGRDEVAARLTMEARNVVDLDDYTSVSPTPRSFWVEARLHDPVRELAKSRKLHVDDLDVYDLGGHFGAENVSSTSEGTLLIRVATIDQEVVIDWAALKEAGGMSGLASIKKNRDGSIEYRVKDPTKALELLGKLHDMFGQRQVHQNPDGSPIKFMMGVSEDDL